eukprot:SAG31_NODE_1017_length_10360_cov_35.198811_3_plen_102_part_00
MGRASTRSGTEHTAERSRRFLAAYIVSRTLYSSACIQQAYTYPFILVFWHMNIVQVQLQLHMMHWRVGRLEVGVRCIREGTYTSAVTLVYARTTNDFQKHR